MKPREAVELKKGDKLTYRVGDRLKHEHVVAKVKVTGNPTLSSVPVEVIQVVEQGMFALRLHYQKGEVFLADPANLARL